VDINSMSGPQFEQYVQKLLADRGYRVSRTGASRDLGIDLVASRTQERIAIQVKRYTGRVSRRAISDAVAGMQRYRRLLEPIENVPPAEAEAYYAALDQIAQAA
jgi:restriction system protein